MELFPWKNNKEFQFYFDNFDVCQIEDRSSQKNFLNEEQLKAFLIIIVSLRYTICGRIG